MGKLTAQLDALEDAAEDVAKKHDAAVKAKVALEKAQKAHADAVDKAETLTEEIKQKVGQILPQANSRVRVG